LPRYATNTCRYYQERQPDPKTLLWTETRFQLASLLLGEDQLARIRPLLQRQGVSDDPILGLRENSAGCMLALLVGEDPAPWSHAVRSRTPVDPDTEQTFDIPLAVALIGGDSEFTARAIGLRQRQAPDGLYGLLSIALLAEASGVDAGEDAGGYAGIAVASLDRQSWVQSLALLLARHGADAARDMLFGAAARLEADHGEVRRKNGPTWTRVKRAGTPGQYVVRTGLSGPPGPIHVFPYVAFRDVAAPWYELSKRCQDRQTKILGDATSEVCLVIECDDDVSLAQQAVDPVRARIPVGVDWLRTLYPEFRCSVTLRVK
jgi:hypothetical protein